MLILNTYYDFIGLVSPIKKKLVTFILYQITINTVSKL